MKKAYIEYCIDGYNLIEKEIFDLYNQLNEIKQETQEIFKAPFGLDIVIEGVGRISIGLAEQTVLCYKSDDYEIQLTAVGNMDAQGETMFYFGDYSLMSNKYLISFDLGIEIINEWIKCGILSMKVNWTEEIL
ncbi:hypothetical protein [Ruminococcus sp.]|uniref:hypothetical protein n=1 Tax=Ruminococcus sp. TaxID=41978 RepID=UPI0025F474C0|nr:hypothetical protein [Ruminococcus sp.]